MPDNEAAPVAPRQAEKPLLKAWPAGYEGGSFRLVPDGVLLSAEGMPPLFIKEDDGNPGRSAWIISWRIRLPRTSTSPSGSAPMADFSLGAARKQQTAPPNTPRRYGRTASDPLSTHRRSPLSVMVRHLTCFAARAKMGASKHLNQKDQPCLSNCNNTNGREQARRFC